MSMREHEDALYGTEYSGEDAKTVKANGAALAIALAAMGFAMFAVGCSGSSITPSHDNAESASTTRTITGKLAIASYGGRLSNPVVYAMAAEDEKATVATVEPSGRFALTVGAGKTYQLLVANRGAGGRLTVVSQVSWRAGAKVRWAKVTGGADISIGNVRPIGASIGMNNYGSGSGGDSEDEDAGASSSSSGSTTSCSGSGSSGSGSADGDACYSDLPYDAKLPIGATYFLEQSFWEKGPSPAKIIKVEVEGGWREAELKANTPFVVTQADCDHQGNKEVGRDRIFVTWQNFDGSTETDHLDMRYCLNEPWPPAKVTLAASCTASPSGASAPAAPAPSSCEEEGGGSVCTGASPMESECDAPGDAYQPSSSSACDEAAKKTDAPCAPKPESSSAPADSGPCGCVPENGACTENAQCASGLACFGSVCRPDTSSSVR